MAQNILLIGGSNVDYLSKSFKQLVNKDSNPGEISISLGGVGRNIVENLARLGDDVVFMTAIGNDSRGEELVEELKELKVRVIFEKTSPLTSSYLAVCDPTGDMRVAICDSTAMDKMDITFLKAHESEIDKHEYVFFDTNISKETIENMIAAYPQKKWCAEAVSVNKTIRLNNVLKNLFLYKGNLMEARKTARLKEEATVKEIIQAILKKGVKNVIVTQGAKEVFYGSKDEAFSVKVKKIADKSIVNATGAGDAMFAGIIHVLTKGGTWKESIEFGIKMSRLALMSESAVSPEVSSLK